MNEIANNFLLAEDNFVSEMFLRQLEFTYFCCNIFIENKKRIQKFKETGRSRYIYQNSGFMVILKTYLEGLLLVKL